MKAIRAGRCRCGPPAFNAHPWNQQSVLLIGNLLNFGGLAVGQQQNERILLELVQAGVSDDKMRELFQPLIDQADFDLLRQLHIRPAALRRSPGTAERFAAPGRQQRLGAVARGSAPRAGRCWPAIRTWKSIACRPSGTRPSCGAGPSITSWGPRCPVARFSPSPARPPSPGESPISKAIPAIRSSKIAGRGEKAGWQYRRGEQWNDFQVPPKKPSSAKDPAEANRTSIAIRKELSTAIRIRWPRVINFTAGRATSGGGGRRCDLAGNRGRRHRGRAMETPGPARCRPSSWVFADREGDIGRQANGSVSRAADGYSGLLPMPAWDENNHWQGWMPTELLPSALQSTRRLCVAAPTKTSKVRRPVAGHDAGP